MRSLYQVSHLEQQLQRTRAHASETEAQLTRDIAAVKKAKSDELGTVRPLVAECFAPTRDLSAPPTDLAASSLFIAWPCDPQLASRVKQTLARRDEVIADLQGRVATAEAAQAQMEAALERQRAELLGE